MIEVRRALIPRSAADAALRVINLDLLTSGYDSYRLKDWTEDHHWLPHLWDHFNIKSLMTFLPLHWCYGTPQPAQIVVQPPYYGRDDSNEPYWHVDEGPFGGRWTRIVGIPLTPWRPINGTLHTREDGALWLNPGDAVVMNGDQEHGVGKNRTGAVRYGVYFRWL